MPKCYFCKWRDTDIYVSEATLGKKYPECCVCGNEGQGRKLLYEKCEAHIQSTVLGDIKCANPRPCNQHDIPQVPESLEAHVNVKSCNQCNQQMQGLYDGAFFFCIHPKCSNFALLQVPLEMIKQQDYRWYENKK